MTLPLDNSHDEARVAQRELYRAGQSHSVSKAPSSVKPPTLAKPSTIKSKTPAVGKSGKTSLAKRVGLGLAVLLGMLLLGGVAYCIFRPDPVEEAKQDLAAIRSDPNLSGKERWEKTKEVFSGLTEKQKMDMSKEWREKDREKMSSFFKLSKEEQVATLKKEILEGEKRRAKWQAERAAKGGGTRQGGGQRGGGAGGAAGTNGRGGAGGAAGAGAGGAGNKGGANGQAGGPGNGGPGGQGGPGGRGGADRNQRQKNFLDSSDPEYRAQRGLYRGMQKEMRQQMGLPTTGRGGFGGGPPRTR